MLIKFLDDNISPELYNIMKTVASKYNQTDSEIRLIEIYTELVNKRISLFENTITPLSSNAAKCD